MDRRSVPQRSNEEWLSELRGPEPSEAIGDLRSLLVRGLYHALDAQAGVAPADIEDFAQEALVKILANLDSFRGESRLTTWAHKISVRVALTELRRRRWKDVSLQDLIDRYGNGDFTPSVLGDSSAPLEDQVARRMIVDLLQRLIRDELTERQRLALTAVMAGGMPLEEVARRMGTNRNALYKMLHDARLRLRGHLTASGLSPADALSAFDA